MKIRFINNYYKRIFIIVIFLQFSVFSQNRNTKIIVDIAPLYITTGEYGFYFGSSISGDVILKKHHILTGILDLAPWGFLGMTDVETNGKVQFWGGSIGYSYQFNFAENFLNISLGVFSGIASIPYIYGTLPIHDSHNTLLQSNQEIPQRENIFGIGPAFGIRLGRNSLKIIFDGRIFGAKDYNSALLTNIGISYIF